MTLNFSCKWRFGLCTVFLILFGCNASEPSSELITSSLNELHDEALIGMLSHLENIEISDTERTGDNRSRVSVQYELVFDIDFANAIGIVADPGSASEAERMRFRDYLGILGTVELTGLTSLYGEFEKDQRFDVARVVDFVKIKGKWIAQP
ncbi:MULTISPECIES: hypothetical protein [Thalassospira]|uniref:hypothetical protein n=1 Tax=Thalassospira TaxID=168934 RepID=UPI0007A59DAE|nr:MULTISPECIES: hypothetical protein [Thalassospira]KZD11253.1 hypothetical protein AUP45_08275 [Thalassospira xiamenensis]